MEDSAKDKQINEFRYHITSTCRYVSICINLGHVGNTKYYKVYFTIDINLKITKDPAEQTKKLWYSQTDISAKTTGHNNKQQVL